MDSERKSMGEIAKRNARILELSRGGLSAVVIAQRMGISSSMVLVIIRRAKQA